MTQKNLLVFLVAVFAFAFAVQSVSALGTITSVEVNGVANGAGIDFGSFAGERVQVLVQFTASDDGDAIPNEVVAEDARIVTWISGERTDAVESSRFDVIEGKTYTRTVFLELPSDLDNDLESSRTLQVVVESEDGASTPTTSIDLTVQRESYLLDILAVDMQSEVQSGESIVADVVLKNLGRQTAEDTFLRVSIPELGLSTQTYFGDLTPTDQSHPDKEDSVERRTYLNIPSNTAVGLYTVVIEAFNSDAFTSLEKRVLIAGAGEDTKIVTPITSKTFSTSETGTYKLTIVNTGSTIRVYDVVLDASDGLNLELDEPIVVVPAGSSRTVEINADSETRDDYTFTAIVSSEGKVVSDESFTASVTDGDGRKTTSGDSANSTAVLLTVILAIVFIVLLVVLIVLLTRKPEKIDESGESYY